VFTGEIRKRDGGKGKWGSKKRLRKKTNAIRDIQFRESTPKNPPPPREPPVGKPLGVGQKKTLGVGGGVGVLMETKKSFPNPNTQPATPHPPTPPHLGLFGVSTPLGLDVGEKGYWGFPGRRVTQTPNGLWGFGGGGGNRVDPNQKKNKSKTFGPSRKKPYKDQRTKQKNAVEVKQKKRLWLEDSPRQNRKKKKGEVERGARYVSVRALEKMT